MTLRSVNPTTGNTLQSFVEMTEDKVNGIVECVHGAYNGWRKTSFSFRAEPVSYTHLTLPTKA